MGAVYNKSYYFAIRIVNLYKYLCNEHKEFVLSKQLLRSGTAIGALYVKRSMRSQEQILYIKIVLHSKRQMKLLTG